MIHFWAIVMHSWLIGANAVWLAQHGGYWMLFSMFLNIAFTLMNIYFLFNKYELVKLT